MNRMFTIFATLSLFALLGATSLGASIFELTRGVQQQITEPYIVGTWQSGNTVLQTFADGHYEVDLNGDAVSDIFGWYSLIDNVDRPLVLTLLDTDGPNMCQYDQVGYYWAEKTQGALRLTVILDPCADRGVALSNRWEFLRVSPERGGERPLFTEVTARLSSGVSRVVLP